MPQVQIRPASLAELETLNQLIKESAQSLSQGYYSQFEIDSLNQYIFGADSDLIADQTYYVIECEGAIAGCGGWSRRATLFGGDQYDKRDARYLDPTTDAAKIRAFFIHPSYARRGLASLLLKHCENEAIKCAFKTMELMSTLPGVEFYAKHGFVGEKFIELIIQQNGTPIKLKPMVKQLG